MKKNILSSNQGFTLIELVIVMAVIGILVSISLNSFVGSINKYNQTVAREKVVQAKNSYFSNNDVDLSDFNHFYFIYEDVVFKGDASGNLNVFTGFESINTDTLQREVLDKVIIYHPQSEGFYSIEIYLETGYETQEYNLYHTSKNNTGYVGTYSSVTPLDLSAKGYLYNELISTQTLISDNPSQNIAKIYYNLVPVELQTPPEEQPEE